MRWRISPLRIAGLLIVLGLNAGLLVNVVSQIASDGLVAVEKVSWNANLSGLVAGTANRKPIQDYGEILARPVFFKSREPFVPPPPPPPPAVVVAPPPPIVVDPGLAVGGVMIKNGLSRAYLLSNAGSEGTWTNEGEMFQGWKVTSVAKTGVRLEQGGRALDLQLYPHD